ncbi:ubiquitin carboxyl-terminal hydrolase isozyme L3 [Hetaerina americana]|uniref:ubiquitin carboxyl-terminal hydrolase isozyme L3 n=1 Tax=Hetaerina americana TaxID=62018 RepID=UPI003A7F3E2D
MSWLPLESNPDYLQSLGVPDNWQIVDVYGLDPELLSTIPQPVAAVLLLFPTSDKYEEHKSKEEENLKKSGDVFPENVYYLKQVVSNACGTIALIHSVANNTDKIDLKDGDLKRFLQESLTMNPEERGAKLLDADGIISTHKKVAQEGQTEAPDCNDPVNFHFVAFVHKDGHLYELDGRKSCPINHGKTSDETLLQDAAKVCREFMERDPDELHFTVVALTGAA